MIIWSRRMIAVVVIALSHSSCAHCHLAKSESPRILNVTSSAVLDQGSYVVDLYFSAGEKPLHLLIAAPSRRARPLDSILILDERGRCTEALKGNSPAGKELHRQLELAGSSAETPAEVKVICAMLDRLLITPEMPWNDVYFKERWQ